MDLPQTAATTIARMADAIVTEDRMQEDRASHSAVRAEKSITPIVLPPETQALHLFDGANLGMVGTLIAMAMGLAASNSV